MFNDEKDFLSLKSISTENPFQNMNAKFMMTPDALKLALSPLPMKKYLQLKIRSNIESLISNQHEEIKSNKILSINQAKKLDQLTISWINKS